MTAEEKAVFEQALGILEKYPTVSAYAQFKAPLMQFIRKIDSKGNRFLNNKKVNPIFEKKQNNGQLHGERVSILEAQKIANDTDDGEVGNVLATSEDDFREEPKKRGRKKIDKDA